MSNILKDSSSQADLLAPSASGAPPRAVWGLFDRKERWSLSWRGRLILASALLFIGALFVSNVYPFLAVTHRVQADALVVEGWVHYYAIRAAVGEFRSGSYKRVFATGGPVAGLGHYVNDYQTAASVGAGLLKNAGVPPEVVETVPSRTMDRDRTYSSAVALRNWLREHNVDANRINIVTEDVHARRTRLLFQKAFGKNIVVGIIAVPNPDYDPKHWWRYSEGVKDVITESAGYLYARFLFWPATFSPNEETADTSQVSQ